MENQHRKISGYRELSQNEIDKMNKIKLLGLTIGALIDELEKDGEADARWVEIGKTNLQQGLMAITRSVAKPTTF